ncbi:hypothetical protein [Hydrogenophaga sp. PAMC20947]|uniref:hypothetical protein n=1 Tax=Hydrogenophaga sp. PAMC20947 TaxID=2565558 RepID=UPI00109E2FEC|nr:hypothetical protein [Hydrogenophaga sp. PAMC20947]QCB48192.1 hypothetical protein E5678_20490 [Hydrogenophaga sp. PAMC20947]
MELEFFRLTIVYGHLIACSVAIGAILVSDFAAVRQLVSGDPYRGEDPKHLQSLQKTVTLALVALWISGAVLVAIDVAGKGMGYFDNPKLQAKIIIVCVLTLNGILLHNTVLPLMMKAKSLLNLSWGQRAVALFTGTFSATSWFYAALLGVGRPLSWKYPLMLLLTPYFALMAGGFAGMFGLVAWAQYRTRKEPRHIEREDMVGAF